MSDNTPNPKHPYGKYNGNELEYVTRVLSSEDPNDAGVAWVPQLECAFAERFGKKYGIACNSATSGLHMALAAAGVSPGDEVISPALNVVMGAYVTLHLGAVPVFADVDPFTHNIDPDDVAKKITPKTKAILAVAWNGLPIDIDPLMALAEKYGIVVIEDLAEDVLGVNQGRLSGTVGHMGVWSFNFKKHLRGATEGGLILTDDPDLATKARKFGGIGYKTLGPDGGSINFGRRDVQNPHFERFDAIGLNYRMSQISAAVCLAQVERMDDLVAKRKIIGRMYLDALGGADWMVPQGVPDGYVHSYYSCAFDYCGAEMRGVPWQTFYDRFMDLGGDGFYAELQCPYNEPAMRNLEVAGRKVRPESGCPVAEDLQPRLMKFKTSYRDLGLAERMTGLLHQVAVEVESGALSGPSTAMAG